VHDESLDIDENCVMVLKNCGPRGYPGMAEVGNMPIPAKLLRKGITDVVRVSDARMSGTAYGTVVLHVSPEAAIGGPLAMVRPGDTITLSASKKLIQMEVHDAELARRRREWLAPEAPKRGWAKLYCDHVLQAHEGADLDFLVGSSGAPIPRDSH
jgi:dihydroxy-acid dehydratase